MKKRWRVAALGICMAMLTCACSTQTKEQETSVSETEEKEETAEEKAERIRQAKLDMIDPSAYANVDGLNLEEGAYFSLIGKSSSDVYWKTIKAGAEDAVDELNELLGYEGSDKIKVVYSGPSTSDDVDEQVSILDEELDRYPSALAISVIDSQSCGVQFDLATMNGIPLVTFDSDGNYQGIMASVMTDHAKASAEAASHMAESLGDAGQVVVVAHDSKSVSSQKRVDSFASELQNNHPNITVANTYYMDDTEGMKKTIAAQKLGIDLADSRTVEGGPDAADSQTEEGGQGTSEGQTTEGDQGMAGTQTLSEEQQAALDDAVQQVTDDEIYDYILEQNPDVNGIFATNGETTSAVMNACERSEQEDIVIMGYDADKEEVQGVEDGRIQGIIVQNPYGMGYAAIVAEARCALNMGNEANVDTGYAWVTPDNVNDENIRSILYSVSD